MVSPPPERAYIPLVVRGPNGKSGPPSPSRTIPLEVLKEHPGDRQPVDSTSENVLTTRTESDQSLTLTVEDAAKLLGIGRSLAYQLVRQGKIPALKFGCRWLIPKAALARMLETCGTPEVDAEGSVPQIGGTR